MPAAQPRRREETPVSTTFERASYVPRDFRMPIDLIAADHERQLAVCDVMDRLLHNPRHAVEQAELEAVNSYLVEDLPLHVADEEADLFPLLKERCPPGDDVHDIFELLRREHETDDKLNKSVCADLETLIGGRAFAEPSRFLMNAFAFSETQRRHLAWENAVILPRARAYLTKEDTQELGRRMAARRGVEFSD